ncbi:MAG: hypothetical protein AB7H90_08380 [Alphaproteobacteria bacterium]
MLVTPTASQIRAKLCAVAFGEPLISNIYRGLVAEIIVGEALGSKWRFCAGDWRGWDFEHAEGCRLEIKQSAARQTWTGSRTASKPIFDVRARKGYFEGTDWIKISDPRRFADIYVFAYHPIMDATADHCDPLQWRFHVIPTNRLPEGKTISLARLALLINDVPWTELETTIESLRIALQAT